MKSLVKYFIIGFKEIFSNKILIISLSVVNLFLISGVVYKAVNNKKELNKFPPYKGIFTTSLNYLNNYGIKELIKNVELWIPIVENIDDYSPEELDKAISELV